MTEDQKAISLILDLLNAAKGVPLTRVRLEQEARILGYRTDMPALLERMEEMQLCACEKDALGIRRYTITPSGKEALDAL